MNSKLAFGNGQAQGAALLTKLGQPHGMLLKRLIHLAKHRIAQGYEWPSNLDVEYAIKARCYGGAALLTLATVGVCQLRAYGFVLNPWIVLLIACGSALLMAKSLTCYRTARQCTPLYKSQKAPELLSLAEHSEDVKAYVAWVGAYCHEFLMMDLEVAKLLLGQEGDSLAQFKKRLNDSAIWALLDIGFNDELEYNRGFDAHPDSACPPSANEQDEHISRARFSMTVRTSRCAMNRSRSSMNRIR